MKRILTKKHKGYIQLLPFLLIVLFIIIFCSIYIIGVYFINCQTEILKDAVDFSNLAVYKNINKEELARSGALTFKDTDLNNAIHTYKKYLGKNMKLDSKLNVIDNDTFIFGNVTILDFRIYSVKNNRTTEYKYDVSSNSFIKLKDNVNYAIKTPKGNDVINTSIYSEVNVKLKLLVDSSNAGKDMKLKIFTDVVN